ncbi:hypothetical protein ACVMB2_003784 [Sinorhizobium meliloti]
MAIPVGASTLWVTFCLRQCAIETAGCTLLYLPPYSPDFNPIENVFSNKAAGLEQLSAQDACCI